MELLNLWLKFCTREVNWKINKQPSVDPPICYVCVSLNIELLATLVSMLRIIGERILIVIRLDCKCASYIKQLVMEIVSATVNEIENMN